MMSWLKSLQWINKTFYHYFPKTGNLLVRKISKLFDKIMTEFSGRLPLSELGYNTFSVFYPSSAQTKEGNAFL